MSLFEDYLSLGYWMSDDERLAMYKFLLKTKAPLYKVQARKLINEQFLLNFFANGEIAYSLHGNEVSYKARKIGETDFDRERRTIKLSKVDVVSINRLTRFFAQAEVDLLRNYPIPRTMDLEERSFAMNVYPYYDLNYFSNGAGKARGFLRKIQYKDDELLEKLLAS